MSEITKRERVRATCEQYEVAKLALFLASDDSEYMNGVEFIIDGGMSQGI